MATDIKLCPHCLQIAATVRAVCESLGADSRHLAMAFVAAAFDEGSLTREEMAGLIEVLSQSSELASMTIKHEAAAVDVLGVELFRVEINADSPPPIVINGRGERNV